jgi:hypothetical protein
LSSSHLWQQNLQWDDLVSSSSSITSGVGIILIIQYSCWRSCAPQQISIHSFAAPGVGGPQVPPSLYPLHLDLGAPGAVHGYAPTATTMVILAWWRRWRRACCMRPDDGVSSFGSGYCWRWRGSWDFRLAMVSVIFNYLRVIGLFQNFYCVRPFFIPGIVKILIFGLIF